MSIVEILPAGRRDRWSMSRKNLWDLFDQGMFELEGMSVRPRVPGHDELGSNRSHLMNVIDFIMSERDERMSLRNLRKRDGAGKPGFSLPHPALAAITFLALCLGLAGCDKCGNPIQINTPKVPGSCYGPNQAR